MSDHVLMAIAGFVLLVLGVASYGRDRHMEASIQCERRGGVYAKTMDGFSCARALRGDAK